MSLKQLLSWDDLLAARGPRMSGQSHPVPRPVGHAHFWHRALTRRQLFKGGAAATALALGAGRRPGLRGAEPDSRGHPESLRPDPLLLSYVP